MNVSHVNQMTEEQQQIKLDCFFSAHQALAIPEVFEHEEFSEISTGVAGC